MSKFGKVAKLKSPRELRERFAELGYDIPIAENVDADQMQATLGEPLQLGSMSAGNRWCIHPMEGWDANTDGSPTEKTLRRWQRFGESGAKLIWGGEAAAVRPDGRANPHQTMAIESNRAGLSQLLTTCRQAHTAAGMSTDDLVVGLQLTHSGRFCRPNDQRLEPRIAYHHPLLCEKYGLDPKDDSVIWSDSDLESLKASYVNAAGLAQEVGFDFVDVKACHGYPLHEFLSARDRSGNYGGPFENRTRLLFEIIADIRSAHPTLPIGVRLSAFDLLPFHKVDGVGVPMREHGQSTYRFGFGIDEEEPNSTDLNEPIRLINELAELGVIAVNLTCGSPYYNPHAQRPAMFPPSDGYPPPEDPLVGVARQITVHRQIKLACPKIPLVGSGYSYLQDFLPHVARGVVEQNWINSVGIGRMVLSYPTLPADALAGKKMERKLICRTFSDCTTGPRNGLVSGCYPLDPYYKNLPEFKELSAIKSDR